jgi:macrolide-specific efflux system membrane fusion protein
VASGRRTWLTRKRAIIGVVVIVVVGAGLGTWLATSSSSASPLITTTTSVHTVGTGTITQSVSSSGTIEPASTADLDFGVSGRVTAVNVTTGQTVTAGQALASVDPTALQAALTQAQATLALDQSQLATDQDDGASSAQIASDQASVASAQTQVTSAQNAVAEATLTSTIAGTVASVDLTVGQQVTGSSSSSSAGTSTGSTGTSGATTGTRFAGSTSAASSATSASSSSASSSSSSSSAQIVVVSTGSYIVDTTVDASQVAQVKVGDQATITVSGATSDVFGTVASVGLLASSSSSVATFPVVIDVTGSPTGLYGGSTATVSITTEELQGVLVVPTTALHYSGNDTTVTLDSDGTKVARTIQVGVASGGDTQVTSGLKAGDKVYVTEVSFHGGLSSGTRSGLFGGTGGGFGGGEGGFSGGTGGGFAGGGGGFGG